MQLFLIRHGQSANNVTWGQANHLDSRVPDPPLTEVGRRQAEILAHFLANHGGSAADITYDHQNVGGFSITHIFCSLMERAVTTGEILSQRLGLPLVAWPDIHECGGIFSQDKENGECTGVEGPGREYFNTHHPELVLPQSIGSKGWWDRPYEELSDLPTRARRVRDDLIHVHGGSTHRVALITHVCFSHFFLSDLLNVPVNKEPTPWFHLNNTGISHISFDESRLRVNYLNRVDFLPADLIT